MELHTLNADAILDKDEVRAYREAWLADLKPGDEATIQDIDHSIEGQDRLREMGLNNGVVLRVIKFAPLGDPMEIKVRGYYLSIRKATARRIRVRIRKRGEAGENQ